jgi:hypothetical protein
VPDRSFAGPGRLVVLALAVFRAHASPKTKSNLATGAHTFKVRTLDSDGNRDKSPATLAFTI